MQVLNKAKKEARMDMNPLSADLVKHKGDLLDHIENAMHRDELKISDVYVARGIADIKVGKCSHKPFQQVANLYSLPLEEVVRTIRSFTNNAYKSDIMEENSVPDIDFETEATT